MVASPVPQPPKRPCPALASLTFHAFHWAFGDPGCAVVEYAITSCSDLNDSKQIGRLVKALIKAPELEKTALMERLEAQLRITATLAANAAPLTSGESSGPMPPDPPGVTARASADKPDPHAVILRELRKAARCIPGYRRPNRHALTLT